ncbi:MAG: hypothetical protein K2M98_08575 [Muribaculum sp.]|nr:hypothetical protein [Muribaculum sp.]
MDIARKYPIGLSKPAPDFFEGALLGNGGMGVVVTTRPDAVVLHFGHNNVWDIRITENHKDKIGTFDEIFSMASAIPDTLASIQHDKAFADYLSLTADNYRSPYPRPFPCGSILLGFDRREVELIGHTLDIAAGICRVSLLKNGRPLTLEIMVDMNRDELWMAMFDDSGSLVGSCFNRVRMIPDPSTPVEFIPYVNLSESDYTLGFMQRLPYSTDNKTDEKDKAFALQLWSSIPLQNGVRSTIMGNKVPLADLERYIHSSEKTFIMHARLSEGPVADVERDVLTVCVADVDGLKECIRTNEDAWRKYWNASAISLDDEELEKIWYRNMYFFNCSVKPGVTCPGIFANWSYDKIGTAWHGDYHLNYNTQQPFWLTFSSNHLDKNMAYVDLVDHLLPVSRQWASEYYKMRGAFFPHSAYPVDMNMHPYPVPDWGWEVFETPWMVQGLWWHYLYTGDTDFLKDRAFGPIKEAVEFLVDYMSRPDGHGRRWGDNGKYHIFPSVPPELYGLQPGFKYNYDTQMDLTLTRHIFAAYLQSVETLKYGKKEKDLVNDVKKILNNMPDYPIAHSGIYGDILVSVPGEGEEIVYNVPANLAVVYPGNEYGLNSPDSIQALVRATINAHRNEGGNEIVFLNMQKARMGMLDIEKFKRQIAYATLPNATITDAVLEVGGRYSDLTDYMYMGPMGIWFENFAIAAVINECLMQCYDGVIRLFPNWDKTHSASFKTLRAQGAFLVSAGVADGNVSEFEIFSEKGNNLVVINPWPGRDVEVYDEDNRRQIVSEAAGMLTMATVPGGNYRFMPVAE